MTLIRKTFYAVGLALCLCTSYSNAQTKILSEQELLLPEQDMKWFRDAKFGMFIHWGLYSMIGKGEWAMFNQRIDVDEYAELAKQFDASKFDANKWAAVAEEAGMKYMVMVSKHHDGFSLWDSQASKDKFNSIKNLFLLKISFHETTLRDIDSLTFNHRLR